MLKHMSKTRAPDFLARGTDVSRQINRNNRIGTVNMKNHFQTVRQSEFLVINLKRRFFICLLGGDRNKSEQKTRQNKQKRSCDFHNYFRAANRKLRRFEIKMQVLEDDITTSIL